MQAEPLRRAASTSLYDVVPARIFDDDPLEDKEYTLACEVLRRRGRLSETLDPRDSILGQGGLSRCELYSMSKQHVPKQYTGKHYRELTTVISDF